MAANRSIANRTFFEDVSTVGVSDFMVLSDASSMNLKFISTGTFTAKITANLSPKSKGGFYPYPCFKLPTYDIIQDVITDDKYIYNVDLTGIDYLRIEIVSISGSLSVYGKVVG